MKPLFALCGAPNCGKTTLFNRLTGAHLAVGNRAGVTVAAQTGLVCFENQQAVLADLPGMYSMAPQGRDEQASLKFLEQADPDVVFCVVRADALARGLFLALELMEWGAPLIVVLSMTDVTARQGLYLDAARLEALLGVPVFFAGTPKGREALLSAAFRLAKNPVCAPKPLYAAPVQDAWEACEALFSPDHRSAFFAIRALESDSAACARLTAPAKRQSAAAILTALEKQTGTDGCMAVICARYARCDACAAACLTDKTPCAGDKTNLPAAASAAPVLPAAPPVYQPPQPDAPPVRLDTAAASRGSRLARAVLHPFWASVWLIALPALIFFVTFGPPGQLLTGIIGQLVSLLGAGADALAQSAGMPPVARSFLSVCIFGQLGALLGFLPQIALLSLFMTLLEDSGMMAYLAVPADRIMRRCGLSGAAFIPLLMGFGCTVPALMAVRALPDADMRVRARHLLPLVCCGARLPMLGLLCGLFFPGKSALMLGLMLFLSLFAVFCTGAALKQRRDSTFLMELPRWHLPKGVARQVGRRALAFLRKTGAVILLVGVPVWLAQSFTAQGQFVTDAGASLLADFGRILAPALAPLGLGKWQLVTSLLCGLAAKESAVSALLLLCGGVSGVASAFTPQSALSFLTFFTLYTPCVAAMAAHVRESERFSHSAAAIGHGLLIAYTAAAAVHLICMLLC